MARRSIAALGILIRRQVLATACVHTWFFIYYGSWFFYRMRTRGFSVEYKRKKPHSIVIDTGLLRVELPYCLTHSVLFNYASSLFPTPHSLLPTHSSLLTPHHSP